MSDFIYYILLLAQYAAIGDLRLWNNRENSDKEESTCSLSLMALLAFALK